ncbi:MAG: aminoglycoside phosphotransferase family protein [Eubacteriales bacterium]|nr:aminoglycoside phosphotransferase family protein [Eubacteriales bacterium]
MADNRVIEADKCFCLGGRVVSAEAISGGHINKTYKLTAENGSEYLLQRINDYVFRDIDGLMSNISAVTEHIRKYDSDARHSLTIVKTKSGKLFERDEQGGCWRVFRFIQGGICLEKPRCPDDLFEGAAAFGRFQRQMADFHADTLSVTIPDFHNTPLLFKALKAAVKADEFSRLRNVSAELDFIYGCEELAAKIAHMGKRGEIPLRVTHNDTKLSNVMLDEKTGRALCVLDLDTVMPGYSVFDYGDAVRAGASTQGELAADASKARISRSMFEALTDGYLSECGEKLTRAELESLPLGAFTMSVELGARFLTDYLSGDRYFCADYPAQNLDRCRTQLALAADIRKHMDEMRAYILSER